SATRQLSTLSLHDALPIYHRDHRFHQHAAVADESRVLLLLQQLGRCPTGDQGVKSTDRAARNRNEGERKDLAGEHRSGAIRESRSEEHTSELQSPYDLVCR